MEQLRDITKLNQKERIMIALGLIDPFHPEEDNPDFKLDQSREEGFWIDLSEMFTESTLYQILATFPDARRDDGHLDSCTFGDKGEDGRNLFDPECDCGYYEYQSERKRTVQYMAAELQRIADSSTQDEPFVGVREETQSTPD